MLNDYSGMLLVNKNSGITSFKVVSTVRKKLSIKKVGHCGTLDPLASGLLLILLGKATKLQENFMKQDKVYRAKVLLGKVTDTGDTDGKIISEREVNISLQEVLTAVQKFVGPIEQIPPMYSALKVNGRRLYELARNGITIERSPRKIIINNIEVLSFEDNVIDMRVHCSSGTYIRSLAVDIGESLGCGATISGLERESIGCFNISNSINVENVMSLNVDDIACKIISCDNLVSFVNDK